MEEVFGLLNTEQKEKSSSQINIDYFVQTVGAI